MKRVGEEAHAAQAAMKDCQRAPTRPIIMAFRYHERYGLASSEKSAEKLFPENSRGIRVLVWRLPAGLSDADSR